MTPVSSKWHCCEHRLAIVDSAYKSHFNTQYLPLVSQSRVLVTGSEVNIIAAASLLVIVP